MGRRFKGYQDYQRDLVIRGNIAEFAPFEPYKVRLPEPPNLKRFINYGLPIEQQFFQREKIPDWVWELTKKSKQKSLLRDWREEVAQIAWNKKEYREFIADQWRKREEGIYIFIYGHPLWIPGNMWYHLNYYYLDVGLPDFKYLDCEYWYWWNECVVKDPVVYAGVDMERRRDGKTSRGMSNMLEECTRRFTFKGGIIGKDNTESKEAFLRCIILPIHRLPFYFMPMMDGRKGLYPSDRVDFRNTKTEEGLSAWIRAGATTTREFDGNKLHFLILNEAGKWDEILVTECWEAHKSCLRVADDIIGKALIETTVEETTKGGLVDFKKLADASNQSPEKLTETGETESGAIFYSRMAWETYIYDQYGFPIIDSPTEVQAEYRRKMFEKKKQFKKIELGHHLMGGRQLVDIEINSKKDPLIRQQTIRKYYRDLREAFRTDSKNCHFNIEIINNRLDDFRYGNNEVIAVNLDWEDGQRDTKVIYREQPINERGETHGKWLFKKSLWEYILSISNNVSIIDGWRVPGNRALGLIACDPYKFDMVDQNRKSMGTAHAYVHYIEEIDREKDSKRWLTDDLFMEYSFRGSVEQYDDDIFKTCTFLGMRFAPELNAGDVWASATRRNYDKFFYYPKITRKENGRMKVSESVKPGFLTMESTKVPLFASVDSYIDKNGHRCVFPRFLEDCRDVEYAKLSPYDYFISGGNAIRLATTQHIRRTKTVSSDGEKGFTGMWQPMVIEKRA